MNDREILEATFDAVLINAHKLDASYGREEALSRVCHRILAALECPTRMRLAAGLILTKTGEVSIMSGSNTYTLTNAADPTKSTRFLGVIDIANGTTLPTVVSSDPTKLAIVANTALTPAPSGTGQQFIFAAYPLDAATETDDAVTVTVSLAGQPDIVLGFSISGTAAPAPQETDVLDAGSNVAAWAGAPNLPTVPV